MERYLYRYMVVAAEMAVTRIYHVHQIPPKNSEGGSRNHWGKKKKKKDDDGDDALMSWLRCARLP